MTHDYNGYLQNQPRLSPNGANDVIVASLAFETGTLGGFYQPANSALADQGSRSAAMAGLYHYTTTRDQVAEQNSTVDIGFHYVAMEPGRLVGHWRFDEESGTLATDDSGYGNDGTRVNGPVAASSKIGAHSLSLDGVNDYVIVQNASVLEVGQNNADFSVFFWIYLTADATGSFRNVFHKGTDPARTFAIWLFPTDNRLHYRISTTANSNEGGNSVGALPLNQWVQVAYVKTGNKLRLYLDGTLDSQATLTAPSVSNTGPLYIGKDPLWAGTQCRIDEVRVYNQAIAVAGPWLAWDTDADGLPDYLEDTNGDGVYNSGDLADFTNPDPNTIAFSISVTNNYVSTSSTVLQLEVTGGFPAKHSVLLDSADFVGATWTDYESSSLTVNLGTQEGWHEVWNWMIHNCVHAARGAGAAAGVDFNIPFIIYPQQLGVYLKGRWKLCYP